MIATMLQKVANGRSTVSPIGLDVGPSMVRAAQIERVQRNQWLVKRLANIKRRESERGVTLTDGFAVRLRETLVEHGFQGHRVVAGLTSPEVELHALELEDRGTMGDKFANAVRWELERVMSTPDTDTVTHFWKVPATKMSRITAMGVVAQAEDVRTVTELVHRMGLDCEQIDATVCALSRLGSLVRRCRGDEPEGIWGMLDLGRRMLRLVVCAGEVPLLVRTLGAGCNSWSQAISESLGVSIDTAEVHKCSYGINTVEGDQDTAGPDQEVAAMILDILRPELDVVAGEVERSYGYAMHCFPERSAGTMFLVGGGAAMHGLGGFLSERLGVDVEPLSGNVRGPGGSLSVEACLGHSIEPFAAAIGLAIEADTP